MTSGDGISACLVCQPPPLGEALGTETLTVFSAFTIRLANVEPSGCCVLPPEENGSELNR